MTAKRVFVTGIGRGLGRQLAQRFHDQGWKVWGSTRSGSTDLPIAGCVELDLADEESVMRGMESLGKRIDSLDLLVNCAGVDGRVFGAAEDRRGPLDVGADVFNAVLHVNVTGPMLIVRHARPLLRNGSIIVNISSDHGSMQVAASAGDDTAYCVSKAALNMLGIKSAAALRDEGIGVVTLHPGWIQTDMGGPDAALTLEEAGRAIVETSSALSLDDSGRFLQWDGRDHPW